MDAADQAGSQVGFMELVRKMRAVQKEWFRLRPEERPPGLLRQCKELERRVDEALGDVEDAQGRLFA